MADTAPRLMLITPPVAEAESFAAALGAAVQAADVAAVVLRLAPADPRTVLARAKVLVEAAQSGEAAALLEGFDDLVGRSGADGCHVAAAGARLADALNRFHPEKIVGAGGIRSRHDAMTAAEAGADYVLFGEPGGDASAPALSGVLERVGWWAELFEVPCAAFASTLDEIAALAAAGANFVLLGDAVWQYPAGPAAAVAEAARRLVAEPAA